MARAVTRGATTTIYGPGDHVAGTFPVAPPLDDTPAAVADARYIDEVLRAEWLRLLERYEPQILQALEELDQEKATQLWRAVERSAYAQIMLATLTQMVLGPLAEQLAAIRPQGGRPPVTQLLALVCGGRDPTTLRAWRSGKQLVPERATDFLRRIQLLELVQSPDDPGLPRLRIELGLDA